MTRSRLILLVSALCAPWLLGGCAATPGPQVVAVVPPPPPATMDTHIKDAAQRFNVPEQWIRAVMAQESGGRTHVHGQPIVSNKGAMGLMQVMPSTYAYLRDAYKLGDDPFDPHDNIMAGTAYIREMYDQYGTPGFLAAYNAGPGRYENHLKTHRPLPAETKHYVAVIAPKIDGVYPEAAGSARPVAVAAPPPAPEPVRSEPVRVAAAPAPEPPQPRPAPEPVRVAAPPEPPRAVQLASADVGEAPTSAPPRAAVQPAPAPHPAQVAAAPAHPAPAHADHRSNLPPGWFVPVAYAK